MDLLTEKEDENESLLPFGKTSQTIKRFAEVDSHQISVLSRTDDNNFLNSSQDLFSTQTQTDFRKPDQQIYQREQSVQYDDQINKRLGLIGRKRSVCLDNYEEEDPPDVLPHPKKLFNRKKRRAEKRTTSSSCDSANFFNKVDSHLMQLRAKQTRRISELSYSLDSRSNEKENTDADRFFMEKMNTTMLMSRPEPLEPISANTVPTENASFIPTQPKPSELSTWDEVESWILNRWKSKVSHKEEE